MRRKTWIIVLLVAIIGGGSFLGYKYVTTYSELQVSEETNQTLGGDIERLQEEKATLDSNIEDFALSVSALTVAASSREGTISELKTSEKNLQQSLTESQANNKTLKTEVSSLEAERTNLQENLTQANSNSRTLTTTLEAIRSPRHFDSVQELKDWLQKDNTDSKDGTFAELCYILQVRALRDGFILPVSVSSDDSYQYFANMAYIQGEYYMIYPDTDEVIWYDYAAQTFPTYPILP